MQTERERLLREYAAGRVSWSHLQGQGFQNYLEVLAGLGELHLRQPVAPMEGPNLAARERGRSIIRRALLQNQPPDGQGFDPSLTK